MDEEEKFWITVVLAILLTICYGIGMDYRMERMMAERGYCYQAVERMNAQPSWQYQKCR